MTRSELDKVLVEHIVQVLHPSGNRYFVVRSIQDNQVVEATSRVARLAAFRTVYEREPEDEAELLMMTPAMFCPGELFVGLG